MASETEQLQREWQRQIKRNGEGNDKKYCPFLDIHHKDTNLAFEERYACIFGFPAGLGSELLQNVLTAALEVGFGRKGRVFSCDG